MLREPFARMPDAVHLDSRSLDAGDNARHLLQEWGVAHEGHSLADAARANPRDGVALPANVHWADGLVTSNEPSRFTQDMVGHFHRSARSMVRFIIECEADKRWTFLPSDNELALRLPVDTQAEEAELPELLTAHPALWALAASELRDTPLAVGQSSAECWRTRLLTMDSRPGRTPPAPAYRVLR
ncbi:hypothetical protein GCM10027072_74950 [Streptomyces bullii]